jgi:hypothetical protein
MGHTKVEHECISRELYFPVADVGHPPERALEGKVGCHTTMDGRF